MTDERSDQAPTGALTEADRFGLLHHVGAWKWESWGLAQAERAFMETVEAIVARHVTEAALINLGQFDIRTGGQKREAEERRAKSEQKAEAALAEAEQKGAREAVLGLAERYDHLAANPAARYCRAKDVAANLRDRAAQIGGQP